MTIEQTMNQILKFKIKQFKDNELEIDQDKLMNCSTLMRESELLRIAKHLNSDNTKPSSKRSNYPYIKDVIITDIGEETDLYKDSKGYLKLNKDRFKRLMASSGNIRNSKVAFVRESLSDKVNDILLCGLPVDQKYDVFAKFSSYFALCSTDSIPVSFLPRIVIIDDFKHEIEETFDLVKETGNDQYEVVNNQKHKTEIMPFDGAGLLSVECAEKFCNDLEINISKDDKANEKESKSKIPACWQFRFIPCGKGDLFTFDIKGFALEKGVKQITDLWGRVWDLFDAEGNLLVDVILTKSQFKFHKLYASYDAWNNAFTTETHGYRRTFNISAFSDAKHLKDSTVLSYQPLQTLSLSQDQVEKLCDKTVNTYKNIRNDIIEFVRYRGLLDKVDEETGEIKSQEEHYLPAYYEALKANADLFNDGYIQSKIKDDLKGFRNRSCKGMLFLRGSFQTLIPDLVGLAQHAFGLTVTGVLKKNEVYNQFWYSKKVGRIALCRFPHIAREWKVAEVVKPDCEDAKYLDYINEGYVINIWDSTALRLGTADFDGDHVYGIAEGRLLEAITKQESNTILHIPPVQTEEEKKTPKPTYPINDMDKLIETDCNGMQGGIGQCVNDITTLWSLPQTEQRDNYIKIMSVIGAQIIDYAKTGILANTPKEIKKFSSKHKLPYFMRYKYPKDFTKETRINVNRKIKGLSKPIEKLNRNQCTVNMVCWYLEKQSAEIDKAAENNQNSFEWQKLLKAKDKPNPYSNTFKAVEKMMEEFNKLHSQISQSRIYLTQPQDVKDSSYKYKIFYDYVRNSLLSLSRANVDIDKILDYLLIICYTDKKYVDKAILWNCFPDEMVSRVKGEYFLVKDFDTKVLELKAKKAKKKIEQNNMASELVKVNLSIDQETKGDKGEIIQTEKINIDVANIKVNIYQSEVSYINKAAITSEHKRVLLVLLAINRLHKQNDARFFICPGKKNKITPSHICKLANISIREYEEIMKSLHGNGFYLSPTGQTNLLIDIPFMDDGEGTPLYTISDLNNIKKYFKILLTKAS